MILFKKNNIALGIMHQIYIKNKSHSRKRCYNVRLLLYLLRFICLKNSILQIQLSAWREQFNLEQFPSHFLARLSNTENRDLMEIDIQSFDSFTPSPQSDDPRAADRVPPPSLISSSLIFISLFSLLIFPPSFHFFLRSFHGIKNSFLQPLYLSRDILNNNILKANPDF